MLLGYLRVPESPDAPLDVVLNPGGVARRAERRVWNNGDQRIKLVRAFYGTVSPSCCPEARNGILRLADREHCSFVSAMCFVCMVWQAGIGFTEQQETLGKHVPAASSALSYPSRRPPSIWCGLQITQAKKEQKSARLRAAAARTAIAETLGRNGVQVLPQRPLPAPSEHCDLLADHTACLSGTSKQREVWGSCVGVRLGQNVRCLVRYGRPLDPNCQRQ